MNITHSEWKHICKDVLGVAMDSEPAEIYGQDEFLTALMYRLGCRKNWVRLYALVENFEAYEMYLAICEARDSVGSE